MAISSDALPASWIRTCLASLYPAVVELELDTDKILDGCRFYEIHSSYFIYLKEL